MIFGRNDKTENARKLKTAVANYAVAELAKLPLEDMRIGFGSGSTLEIFIGCLKPLAGRIRLPAAGSSDATAAALKKMDIIAEDTNSIRGIDLYIDGADKIDTHFRMIKGGGGALTGEKILAWQAREFWCLADHSKQTDILGDFPVAVEVVQNARSLVARELTKMGGSPEYRQGFVTDHGNPILDVYNLDLGNPAAMEEKINNLPGAVCNGIFAKTPATRLLCACPPQGDGRPLIRDLLPASPLPSEQP